MWQQKARRCRVRRAVLLSARACRSIAERDYEKVIKDYRKAKQLISTSPRAVYRQVWAEVVALISELRTMLLATLTAAGSGDDGGGGDIMIAGGGIATTAEGEPPWRAHLPAVKCLVQVRPRCLST